jgi:hypothetical protein
MGPGIGIESQHDVTIERCHERDPRQHRRAIPRDEHQGLDRDLPLRQLRFLFGQSGNVIRGITQRVQLPAIGKIYRFFKFALPVLISHGLPAFNRLPSRQRR